MNILKQSVSTIQMNTKQLINNVTSLTIDAIKNCSLTEVLKDDVHKQVTDILSGLTDSEIFYKNVLERMVIYPNQQVEVKLNLLPQKWIFVLQKRSD